MWAEIVLPADHDIEAVLKQAAVVQGLQSLGSPASEDVIDALVRGEGDR